MPSRHQMQFLLAVTISFAIAASARSEPPKPKAALQPVRTDVFGDPLPTGALARMGSVRFRPGGSVRVLAFSVDGKLLASGGEGTAVCLWETATGKEVQRLQGHQACVLYLAFSPDGRSLASGDRDGGVHVWKVATGKELGRLAGKPTEIWLRHKVAFTFAGDGNCFVAKGRAECLEVWNATTSEMLWQLPIKGQNAELSAAAFSADGKTLVTATRECISGKSGVESPVTIHLRDTKTGKQLSRLHKPESVGSTHNSSDGKILAASDTYHKKIYLWDASNGKELRQLPGNGEIMASVGFSADGKFLAFTDYNSDIYVWQTDTGKEARRISGSPREFLAVAFSPDSKLIAAAGDGGAIRLWEMASGKERHLSHGARDAITSVALSPDGKTVATAGKDTKVRLWECASGREIRQLTGHRKWVYGVAFAPDGKTLASVSRDRTVRLWTLPEGKQSRQFGEEKARDRYADGREQFYSVVFSPDGKRLAVGPYSARSSMLWDVATGQQLDQFANNHFGLVSVAFSADGKAVAGAGRGVFVWKLPGGEKLHELGNPDRDDDERKYTHFISAAFSPDGKLLASWYGGTEAGSAEEGDFVFKPRGEGKLCLWDLPSGREWTLPKENTPGVRSIAFSPDGRGLVLGKGDGTIRIWELATRKERCRLEGHRGAVDSIVFSADGRTLVSGSADTMALVWDLMGRQELTKLSKEMLEQLWNDLASDNASTAYRAINRLVAMPDQSVSYLKNRLKPLQPADAARTARLLADLDNDDFAVREKASAELTAIADTAIPVLRKTLADSPSAEVRGRVENILREQENPLPATNQLQAFRGLEVLEYIGTPEARRLLEALARGVSESRLTQQAKASSERLSKRLDRK